MRITREVALNEVYLDHQARAWQWPQVPAREWASEIAKALVCIVGIGILVLLMVLLTPSPTKADPLPFSTAGVSSYLDSYTPLPLASGVDTALALDLINAQRATWGTAPKQWQPGSLLASETSVLKAIGVYVYAGGPDQVTFDKDFFWLIWAQSNIAIDTGLTVGFGPASIDFGEAPVVSTPEPGTLLLLCITGWLFCLGLNYRNKASRP